MMAAGARTGPILLQSQRSGMVGGAPESLEPGSHRGGHLYVASQVPANARGLPLLFIHGGSTTGVSWESTPDGREGFSTLMLRRGYPVHVVDLPGCGRAAGSVPLQGPPPPLRDEAGAWEVWRVGRWRPPGGPEWFPGSQMARTPESVDQLLRFRGLRVADFPSPEADRENAVRALRALLDEIGPAVLVTHSHGGQLGWVLAAECALVRAVVAYEPATFAFPVGQPPPLVPTADPTVARITAPIPLVPEAFDQLSRVPMQLVYGDNIQRGAPQADTGAELWRINAVAAGHFAHQIATRGGRCEVLSLPDEGVAGNTHLPFLDLNNELIADRLAAFVDDVVATKAPSSVDGRQDQP